MLKSRQLLQNIYHFIIFTQNFCQLQYNLFIFELRITEFIRSFVFLVRHAVNAIQYSVSVKPDDKFARKVQKGSVCVLQYAQTDSFTTSSLIALAKHDNLRKA